MSFFNQIKWAYQRVIRGYDDRIYWAFDEYFEQFIEPLENFCLMERQSSDTAKKELYKHTLDLIKDHRNKTETEIHLDGKLWKYVGEHLGWYWS